MGKVTKQAQDYIAMKMKKLHGEGLTQSQAAGKAYGMAREKGYKIPVKKKKKGS